jgi:hypothetical protein
MAKTVSLPFDLSVITLAFSTAEAAAAAFDCLTADMLQWNHSGVYPSNADIKAALTEAGKKPATAAVYASAILKWARSGKLPKSLHDCIGKNPPDHVKSKAGRPAGQGAGKTTASAAVSSGAAVDPLAPSAPMKDAPSPMHFWVRELGALNAGATILRDTQNRTLSAADANALKDAVSKCIALLGKYTI